MRAIGAIGIAAVAGVAVTITTPGPRPHAAVDSGRSSLWVSSRLPAPSGSPGRPFVAEAVACVSGSTCYAAGDTFNDFTGGSPAVVTVSPKGLWAEGLKALDPNDSNLTVTVSCSRQGLCAGGGSFGPGNNLDNGYATATLLMKRGPRWIVERAPLPSPNLGGGAIVDMSCVGAGFCAGVGYDYSFSGTPASIRSTSHGLIETYVNGRWRPQQAPTLPGQKNRDTAVTKVVCRSADNCIAIDGGDSWPIGSAGQSTILTLSQDRWRARRAPTPPGSRMAQDIQLDSIACPPANGSCVIVGSYATGPDPNAASYPLLLSQVGSGWRAATLHSKRFPWMYAQRVSCPSTRLCVAAGIASASSLAYFAGFIRSHGKWSETVLPYWPANLGSWDPVDAVYGITGIACASVKSCMAVGLGNPYQLIPLTRGARAFAYSAGKWKAEQVPKPRGVTQAHPAEMMGVAARGAGYVAIGNFFARGDLSETPQGMVARTLNSKQ